MKLRDLILRKLAGDLRLQSRGTHFFKRTFGQNISTGLNCAESSMSLPFARKAAICFCWGLFLASPAALFSQTNYYSTNGTEYAVAGSLPGDQVLPDIALNGSGGFVVWQDNVTDGNGWGISATKLDATLSPDPNWSDHRVNVTGANDQENARAALLKNGGAVFVWQGGVEGISQHIYARFLSSSNTFLSATDIVVSAFAKGFQVNPAVAVLNNGNVVIVWSSFNQAGSNSLMDVYAKILSPTGTTVSNEFLVNQFFTTYNQRSPAVAALKNGGFVVAWISEQERLVTPVMGTNTTYYALNSAPIPSVDVFARLYQSNGAASGGELLINTNFYPCANPAVVASADGGFMVAWSGRDMMVPANGWDIYARPFSTNGVGGNVTVVNTHVVGNQYAPRLNAIASDYLIVWTSLSQDSSREGVYGRFVHNDGTAVGDEFRVNTTVVSQQMQPVVASDGANQFLALWTSYTGSSSGFDLFAQRYVNVASILLPMNAPYVWAPFTLSNNVYQPQLNVSWPTLLGISVSNFEVYVDGAASPAGIVTSNSWTMTAANGLTKNSTHSFTVDYVTMDGRRSPMSPSASGTTWSGDNWGGIPAEWMKLYFGTDFFGWPSPTADSDGDGVSNIKEFQAGTDPTDAGSALRQELVKTPQGMFLNWNTIPGLTYQVQMTTNLTSWTNLGAPRFAAGTNDSIYVGGNAAGYYRVQLQR